jgi:hypothetical protein
LYSGLDATALPFSDDLPPVRFCVTCGHRLFHHGGRSSSFRSTRLRSTRLRCDRWQIDWGSNGDGRPSASPSTSRASLSLRRLPGRRIARSRCETSNVLPDLNRSLRRATKLGPALEAARAGHAGADCSIRLALGAGRPYVEFSCERSKDMALGCAAAAGNRVWLWRLLAPLIRHR